MEGEVRRDTGLKRVSRNDFIEPAIAAIEKLPLGHYSSESIRTILTKNGIKPHHYNAWGALFMTAIRRKLLINTGKRVKAKRPCRHAQQIAVYSLARPKK